MGCRSQEVLFPTGLLFGTSRMRHRRRFRLLTTTTSNFIFFLLFSPCVPSAATKAAGYAVVVFRVVVDKLL